MKKGRCHPPSFFFYTAIMTATAFDDQFIQSLIKKLMDQDSNLTAGDAEYAVRAILRAREETTNRIDQIALFYELMDGKVYGHTN